MKKRWRRPLALLAAAAVWMQAAGIRPVEAAVDLGKECTLSVEPGGEAYAQDLAEAGVVTDLYKVAEALPLEGSDGYSYGMLAAYGELSVEDGIGAEGWKELAQEAAGIALNGQEEPAVAGAECGEAAALPGAGLYLLVARGRDAETLPVEVTDEEGRTRLATQVLSGEYVYTFLPELVSVPGKEAEEAEDGSVAPPNTANPGDWVYDVEVTLKPQREARYGSLRITKRLTSYETKDPATFVFLVEAVKDGELVYSNVVSLTFTEPGMQETLVERLPVGAEVTVTEIYSGASYTVSGPDSQTVTVEAEAVAGVEFTNDYTGERRGGYGILNHFEAEGGEWVHEKDPEAAAQ